MQGLEIYFIFALLLFFVALWLFFWAIPVPLWISAIAAQVKISLFSLVGMRLRRVPPTLVVGQL